MTVTQAGALLIALLLPVAVAFTSWRAIRTARTPQGAVGWVVFLLAAPWFALPAYLVLGHHRFRNFEQARRDSQKISERLAEFGTAFPPRTRRDPRWRAFETLALMPAVGGNGARLLVDGQATFEAIFAAIDGATDYVCVQFYTIRDDGLGRELADRLIAAAGRGVAVRVLYDAVGSYALPRAYADRLRVAGVQVVDPHRSRGPRSRFDVNFRNHRKMVIVDGRVGFLGGHNVGDEYLGKVPAFGRWRDTHVRLAGPAVTQLQVIFAEDWHWAGQEPLGDALHWMPEGQPDGIDALIIATGPGDRLDSGSLFFTHMLAAARRRVWITSPYCVPDMAVQCALQGAALRGCDVRLLVPDAVDHTLPWLAAFGYFDDLRDAGVEIWRYTGGFLHQKTVLVDDDLVAIGTTNLDNRSFRLNFEAMAVVIDQDFAAEAEVMLARDFAEAYRLEASLDEQPLKIRVGAPLARLMAPIL